MNRMPPEKTKGNWVQTERESHEAWAALTRKSPLAAQIMHLLAARVGEHNAVVISQGALADLAGASRRGVQNALNLLDRERWIEIRQIGERSTVNAYVVNDRVVWGTARNGLRYSLFSATVVLTSAEQQDATELDRNHNLRPLRQLPSLYRDEEQLPSGDGLPPPSQPFLDGLEPSLPTTSRKALSDED
jgi:DNA-binding transcriptional MocR family regulator